MATAFISGPVSFAIARFCLGVAEAGFTPASICSLPTGSRQLARQNHRRVPVGIPVANIIGSPISGALMQITGHEHIRNWQWLLLIEGLPAVILGVMCLFVLSDRPEKARWLAPREQQLLSRRLADEQQQIAATHGSQMRDALRNPLLYLLAFINFCGIVGSIGGTVDAADHQTARCEPYGNRLSCRAALCLRCREHAVVGARMHQRTVFAGSAARW